MVDGSGALLFLAVLVALRRGFSLRVASLMVIGLCCVTLFLIATLTLGAAAIMTPWLVVVVLLAIYLLGPRAGVVTAVGLSLGLLALVGSEQTGLLRPPDPAFLGYAVQQLAPAIASLAVATALGIVYRTTLDREMQAKLAMERELRQAQRLEAMGQLVAGFAHEVNNPLTFILANVESVREDLADKHATEFAAELEALDDALVGVDRVRRIVADLRAFSREADEPPAWVPVASLVDFSLKLAGNVVRHAARLTVDVAPGLEVDVPQARLGQVLVNLLCNAAQAIRPGEPDRNEITVRAFPVADGAAIEVLDTGAGMDADVLERISTPSSRPSRSASGPGSACP